MGGGGVRRITRVYSVYAGLEETYNYLSMPANFLRLLQVFDRIKERDGEADVEIQVKAAFGVVRRLRARFRRVLEPPRKIVYIGEGNFVMTIDIVLEALTPTETRLELVMQLSAGFIVESALNYRMNLALEDFGTRLQEAVVKAGRKPREKPKAPARPAAPPTPAAPAKPRREEKPRMVEEKPKAPSLPAPSRNLEESSEALSDILIVSELLLNSKHIRTFRSKIEDAESLVKQAAKGAGKDYLYITVNIPANKYLARILAYRGSIAAATLEAGGKNAKGSEALKMINDAKGMEAEISVLEPPAETVRKIVLGQ